MDFEIAAAELEQVRPPADHQIAGDLRRSRPIMPPLIVRSVECAAVAGQLNIADPGYLRQLLHSQIPPQRVCMHAAPNL